jgi:two-component system alkaline phosphatase synthesis response regulator PhoP
LADGVARVLIVDDEPDILLMLRVNLSAEGYDTLLAADGQKALERISEDDPDVVLLDVMMPVMDGWGVLNALKDNGGEAPPVIVVSAKSSDRDIAAALNLGAVAFITKPFDPHSLVEEVDRVLSSTPEELEAERLATIARCGG